MSDPKRHDIFEDESGKRVAIMQLMDPNALGIVYVEYKNLSDSKLRFLTKEQFLELFKLVDNFGTTDTHAQKLAKEQAIVRAEEQRLEKEAAEAKAAALEQNTSSTSDGRKADSKPGRSA
jgi:hypothetical protein